MEANQNTQPISLNVINTKTFEGQLFMAALAILTTTSAVLIKGETVAGRETEPDVMLNYVDKLRHEMYDTVNAETAELPTGNMDKYRAFERELTSLINRFSMESRSNTPDHLLARHMIQSLYAFETTSTDREQWFGKRLEIGGVVDIESGVTTEIKVGLNPELDKYESTT